MNADSSFRVTGTIVDPLRRETYAGSVHVRDGRIARLERHAVDEDAPTILPGFVDAHVHIESSMLTPSEFARAAVRHGTVATVSDPHEIANVLGMDGVRYMIEDGQRVPFKFNFGAPSCVPATPFETAGATLGPDDVATLLDRPEVRYLSEAMNYPGVLSGDADMLAKIDAAKQRGLPVDGHAPGLRGDDARRYADAGISTEHECVTIDEARDKLAAGMHIAIREGSAAKNFDALIPLMDEAPDRLMFCTDDAHPDALIRGHIDALVRRALARGTTGWTCSAPPACIPFSTTTSTWACCRRATRPTSSWRMRWTTCVSAVPTSTARSWPRTGRRVSNASTRRSSTCSPPAQTAGGFRVPGAGPAHPRDRGGGRAARHRRSRRASADRGRACRR